MTLDRGSRGETTDGIGEDGLVIRSPRDSVKTGRLLRDAERVVAVHFHDDTLDLSPFPGGLLPDLLWEVGQLLARKQVVCRTLRLRGWKSCSAVSLRALLVHLGDHVRRLDVGDSAADEHFLRVAATFLGGLSSADISHCPNAVNDCVTSLVKCGHHTLTALDFSHCPNLSIDAMGWIAGTIGPSHGVSCKRLLSLRASHLPAMRDLGLVHLATGCKNIRFLDLSHCEGISDRGIKALVGGCTALQVLDLEGCHRVTDRGVLSLSRRCKRLRALSLRGLEWLTDRAMWHLSRGCSELQSLDISQCFQISELGLFFLGKGCLLLSQLKANGVSSLSKRGMEHLVKGIGDTTVQLSHRWHGLEPTADSERVKLDRQRDYVREANAVRIQAWYRGCLSKSAAVRLRHEQAWVPLAHAAASAARGRQSVFADAKRADVAGRNAAAAVIQRQVRWRHAHWRILRTRLQRARELAAVTTINRLKAVIRARGANNAESMVRDTIMLQREARLAEAKAIACLPIQAIVRGFLARRRARETRILRQVRERQEVEAAIRIQAQFRAWRARQTASARRFEKMLFAKILWHLAEECQRLVRGFLGRLKARWMRSTGYSVCRAQLDRYALQIQSMWRCVVAQRALVRLRHDFARETSAAITVQRIIRGFLVVPWRELAVARRKAQLDADQEEHVAAMRARARERRRDIWARSGARRDSASDACSDDDWEAFEDQSTGWRGWWSRGRGEFTSRPPVTALESVLVGCHVLVYWPAERRDFRGTFRRWVPTKRKLLVVYDDGDREWIIPHTEKDRMRVWWNGAWVPYNLLPHAEWRRKQWQQLEGGWWDWPSNQAEIQSVRPKDTAGSL